MASCAGESVIEPSAPSRPQNTLFEPLGEEAQPVSIPEKDLDDLRPLASAGEEMAAERILLQRALNQHRQPVHPLPHVGVAQRQMHLHAGRNDHHRAASRSETWRRTASGSAPNGAKTRRPSVSSTTVMPSGGCNRSCSTSGVEVAPICPLASFTAASDPDHRARTLDEIAAAAAEDEQMARMRIALQRLLHDQRQPVEPLAHIGAAHGQPNPNARRDRDHRRVNVLTTRASAVASTSMPTMIRSPPESTISIRRSVLAPRQKRHSAPRPPQPSPDELHRLRAAVRRGSLLTPPGEQKIGVDAIALRDHRHRRARLQALGDHPTLLVARPETSPPRASPSEDPADSSGFIDSAHDR